MVAAPICGPTGGAQGFPFPHTLADACYRLSLTAAVLTGVRQASRRGQGVVLFVAIKAFRAY